MMKYEDLKDEYFRLFKTMTIKDEPAVRARVDAIIFAKNRDKYDQVEKATGVPWFFIAILHSMESNLNFKRHLHNGDPLKARTVQVPAGRPKFGKPPFTWEESAIDAIKLKSLHKIVEWDRSRMLYEFERYNGWGYRRKHPEVLSPYLWSMTNHYKRGKYIADGQWSATAVSKQIGAAAMLKFML